VRDNNAGRAALASRTTIGGNGATLLIAGPRWTGASPAGTAAVHVATDRAWIVARLAVDGQSDLASVRDLQDGLKLASDEGR
jgi:hypothetical protein